LYTENNSALTHITKSYTEIVIVINYYIRTQNSHFDILKLNIELNKNPPSNKLSMTHLAPSLDADRRPCVRKIAMHNPRKTVRDIMLTL